MKLPKIVFFAVILFYLVNLTLLINEFNQLPSPIYGGDAYHQLGQVQHILSGGNWFSGYNIPKNSPGYSPLFAIYAAFIAKITGMKAISAVLYSSLLSTILSILVLYYFFKRFFDNEYVPIILILLFVPVSRLLVMKYSIFSQFIIMPLFFLLLYNFYESEKNKYWLAITYGLLGLAHPISFIIASIMLVIFTVYFKKTDSASLKKVGIIFLVGILIAQLYWFEPIFVHHMKSSEHYLDWNNEDFSSFSVQINYLKDAIKGYFFNFFTWDVFSILPSILSLLGLILLFLAKKANYNLNFLHIFNISSFFLLFSYIITRPILGMDLYPIRINDFLFFFNAILLAGFGLNFLLKKTKNYQKHVSIILICLLVFFSFNAFKERKNTDKWYDSAREKLPDKFLQLQKFALENTDVNDVFISSNELSFALNALTGRKLLNTRRAQNSPYLDMDERILASAAILYGNDTNVRKNLIEKYQIKYLLWDQDWVPTEYRSENGKILPFDPLNLFDNEEKRNFLTKLNISYQPQHTWVDPALAGDTYRKFDLLLIVPNYKSLEQPWNDDLNNYLEEVFNFDNTTKIYKIKFS
ncbi:hypothetical protein HZA97_03435 [Candidatus Woesearchaeota archaeon]|nr:hypothetical protein [Candidatus Woesearchaeota archaeon]